MSLASGFMVLVTAECVSPASTPSPLWLQATQATGAVAATVGVLIAVYIALIREPREASEVHRHHLAQMAELRRAKKDRAQAHARKLVPSCARAPILGDSWWTVRIDNGGLAAATIHSVGVIALDAEGIQVPEGCRQADNARSAFSESLALQQSVAGELEQALQTAVSVHFVKQWPRILAPHRHAAIAYTTDDPSYRLSVTVDYEDDEGFRWRRTDAGEPTRVVTAD